MIGFRGEQVIGLVENPQLPTRWACRGARSRQGRELSVAVRKLQAVAPRDPVMPVADGFFG